MSADKIEDARLGLIFDPGSRVWALEIEGETRRLAGPAAIDDLLTILPARIWPGMAGDLVFDGDAALKAFSFDQDTGSIELLLSGAAGADDRHLALTVRPLPPVASWLSGRFPDGWIELDAALCIRGLDVVGLRLFLPPKEGGAAKQMTVSVNDETFGTFEALRSAITELRIPVRSAWRDSVIRLHASYAEEAVGGDERQLGFVATILDGGEVLAPTELTEDEQDG